MGSFSAALRAVNSLKAAGVVEDYAIAKAMAILFWAEPVPTYDLDVLVFLPAPDSSLVSLDAIYRWAAERGYSADAEHVMVEGLPRALSQDSQARGPGRHAPRVAGIEPGRAR